jgi:hypothetical protein
MNSEGISYSALGGRFAAEWVLGWTGTGCNPLEIGEMDVSNDPESSHRANPCRSLPETVSFKLNYTIPHTHSSLNSSVTVMEAWL